MKLDEWSVLWEAVAAIGTVGAVLWAVYTTIAERRKRTEAEDALTKEKNASRIAKRREQAEHVAVWFEVGYSLIASGRTSTSTAHGQALVGNYSGAPIFNVKVTGEIVSAGLNPLFLATNVVPPGPEPRSADLGDAAQHEDELLLHVEFQDVAGAWWRRSSRGDLEEIANPTPWP